MSISTAKLLKVGGPALTGIGGVIATSSLVSKSAEEKPEEKIKTRALSDEDPTIKEWKDRNESEENQGEGDGNPSSGQNTSGSQEGEEGSEKSSSSDNSDGKTGEKTDGEQSQSEKSDAGDSSTDGGDDSSSDQESSSEGSGAEQISSGDGITDSGSEDANHNNALGNAYGNIDRAMTAHEVEKTIQLRNSLEGLLGDLKGLNLGD
ncbi:hypothetical protein MHC_03910 [Mycoplasma haemocanis str. Illinois]|uniref:Uncharacterized protein n=1 Tax=Mycoplasma haemocanis (strain Illinois) TaxID=1111676 RepID=H6N7L8_MYCHN|nr:hypothetical protein [Mycoplasma haemocanis]AEW45640.1 hypothetical protein MHC_03910 [Mycoplasma haemocanis str. Illinois]